MGFFFFFPEPGGNLSLSIKDCCCKSLQSCPTLCDPIRPRPTRLPRPWDSPGRNTGVGCHFPLQCMKVKVKSLIRVRLFATPWTAAYQAPLSMGISRQEYWSGVPSPSPILKSYPKSHHQEPLAWYSSRSFMVLGLIFT